MKRILVMLMMAMFLLSGCSQNSSIGVIGGSDGPTSIILTK